MAETINSRILYQYVRISIRTNFTISDICINDFTEPNSTARLKAYSNNTQPSPFMLSQPRRRRNNLFNGAEYHL